MKKHHKIKKTAHHTQSNKTTTTKTPKQIKITVFDGFQKREARQACALRSPRATHEHPSAASPSPELVGDRDGAHGVGAGAASTASPPPASPGTAVPRQRGQNRSALSPKPGRSLARSARPPPRSPAPLWGRIPLRRCGCGGGGARGFLPSAQAADPTPSDGCSRSGTQTPQE